MMRLLIDAGNTNIKLAWVDEDSWLPILTIPVSQTDELERCLLSCGEVQQVWVSNVAGAELERQIRKVCAVRSWQVFFIASKAMQCGVRNAYEPPATLGCDRWAALIYARHRIGSACLVVCSGTATTIDALSDSGEFLGGLILPGIVLMQASLIGAAANLQLAGGSYANFPRNTMDAMQSGAIQASVGAILLQHGLMGADVPVLLGGGAALQLLPHITLPVRMMDNAVLQGLLLIAREDDRA